MSGGIKRNTFPSRDTRQWEAKKEWEPLFWEHSLGFPALSLLSLHPTFPNWELFPPHREGTAPFSLAPFSSLTPPPFPNKSPNPSSCYTLPIPMCITRFLSELIKSPFFYTLQKETFPTAEKRQQRSPKSVTAAPDQSPPEQIWPAESRSFQCPSALMFQLTHLQRQDTI